MKTDIPLSACTVTDVTIRQVPNGKQVDVNIQLESSEPELLIFYGAGDLDEIGTLVDAEFLSVSSDRESQLEFGTVSLSWMTGADEIYRLPFDDWQRLRRD